MSPDKVHDPRKAQSLPERTPREFRDQRGQNLEGLAVPIDLPAAPVVCSCAFCTAARKLLKAKIKPHRKPKP